MLAAGYIIELLAYGNVVFRKLRLEVSGIKGCRAVAEGVPCMLCSRSFVLVVLE